MRRFGLLLLLTLLGCDGRPGRAESEAIYRQREMAQPREGADPR